MDSAFKPGDAVTVYGRPYVLVERVKRSWAIQAPDGKITRTGEANVKRAEKP